MDLARVPCVPAVPTAGLRSAGTRWGCVHGCVRVRSCVCADQAASSGHVEEAWNAWHAIRCIAELTCGCDADVAALSRAIGQPGLLDLDRGHGRAQVPAERLRIARPVTVVRSPRPPRLEQ